jgi:hypothetical protein
VVDGVPGKYPTGLPDPAPENPPKFPEAEDAEKALYGAHYGTGIYYSPDAGTSWSQRIGSRAGAELNSRTALTDPWGPNRLKQGSWNPERAILWDGGLGYIFRSTDAGRSWVDVTPATNPTNSWNDTPAPTPSDLYYEYGASDWHVNKRHYWIAWYLNASSEYRGYLLYTDNDGLSWAWYPLGRVAPAAAQWYYLWAIGCEPETCAAWEPKISNLTVITIDNVLGAGDGNDGGCTVDTLATPPAWVSGWWAMGVYDPGFWYVLSNVTVDMHPLLGAINTWLKTGIVTDPVGSLGAFDIDFLEDGTVEECSCLPAGTFYNGITQNPPASTTEYGSNTDTAGDYVRLVHMQQFVNGVPAGPTVGVEFDFHGVYPHAVSDEVRPISLALDFETGRYLYMTTWEGEALRLRVYDLSACTGLNCPMRIRNLGACTKAQFNNRTYFAGVRALYDPAVANYGLRCIVYGRFNAGNDHLLRSLDGGATLTDIGDSATWGADWIGAAVWQDWDSIWILRNGVTDRLTETTNGGGAWTNRTNSPFEVEFAMTMHNGVASTRAIAIGQRNGAGVQKLASPYTGAWVAINPGGAGTRVGALHWLYNEVP